MHSLLKHAVLHLKRLLLNLPERKQARQLHYLQRVEHSPQETSLRSLAIEKEVISLKAQEMLQRTEVEITVRDRAMVRTEMVKALEETEIQTDHSLVELISHLIKTEILQMIKELLQVVHVQEVMPVQEAHRQEVDRVEIRAVQAEKSAL